MGKNMQVMVAIVVLAMFMSSARHGSKAVELCNMTEDGLTACKPAVTKPDPTLPSAECCQALTGADLKCLCSYKDSFVLPSLGIDPDLAMELPTKCNLTPPQEC